MCPATRAACRPLCAASAPVAAHLLSNAAAASFYSPDELYQLSAQAATQLVSIAAAASLLLGTPHIADAASTGALASAATAAAAGGDNAAETVQLIAEEEGRAAYKATLEENAKKAEILAK